jgi:hypothetical protein
MNHPTEELRLPADASHDQARVPWQLAVYVILVAAAIYHLCVG